MVSRAITARLTRGSQASHKPAARSTPAGKLLILPRGARKGKERVLASTSTAEKTASLCSCALMLGGDISAGDQFIALASCTHLQPFLFIDGRACDQESRMLLLPSLVLVPAFLSGGR